MGGIVFASYIVDLVTSKQTTNNVTSSDGCLMITILNQQDTGNTVKIVLHQQPQHILLLQIYYEYLLVNQRQRRNFLAVLMNKKESKQGRSINRIQETSLGSGIYELLYWDIN